ncbi:GntR family transcriptional regulator [Nonomuraea sp. NPDC049695]|uniref:GntR family transcriptional regulator n=1 Tax=Nonomuraea sp. NPDC049695 TaxID=3154734 RepID=UPI003435C196
MAANGTGDASASLQASEHQDQDQSKAPLYEIIRDELIADIEAGNYPVGALLPSIRDMSVRWTVSTTTARRVLSELVNAGYARPEGTRGHIAIRPASARETIVKGGLGAVSRQGVPAPTPTVRTAQVITTTGTVSVAGHSIDVRSEPAPPEVAMALSLADLAAPVVVRRRVTTDSAGNPVQFRVSYIAPSVATENTPLAASAVIDEPWHEVLAACAGSPIKIGDSYICARHPSDTEAAMLALHPAACVLVRVERAFNEDDQPVDYTVTVWPGDTTRMAVNPS